MLIPFRLSYVTEMLLITIYFGLGGPNKWLGNNCQIINLAVSLQGKKYFYTKSKPSLKVTGF